jgi:hypothetical protein
MSRSEAAKRTPYTANFLRLLARRGKLQVRKIGRDWLITSNELSLFMKRQQERHQHALDALRASEDVRI